MYLIDFNTEEKVWIPSKCIVCPRCDGKGVHDHESFSNGINAEDFDEDPDFREDYLNGHYDVRCSECNGVNVINVPNKEECNSNQLRIVKDHERYQYEDACEKELRSRGIEF